MPLARDSGGKGTMISRSKTSARSDQSLLSPHLVVEGERPGAAKIGPVARRNWGRG